MARENEKGAFMTETLSIAALDVPDASPHEKTWPPSQTEDEELGKGFRKALTSFKNRLDPKEVQDFQITTLKDVHFLINRVQEDQRKRKTLINMNRIKAFLEGMNEMGEVIKIFAQTNDIMSFIWGPLKLILQIASTWADAFDMLLDTYESIGEQLPLLKQYASLFTNHPQTVRVLELMYGDILEFHRKAMKFFVDPVWKQFFKSTWKTSQTRYQHIIDSLRRHKQLIESQAQILHFQQYQSDRGRILNEVDRSEAHRQKQLIESQQIAKELEHHHTQCQKLLDDVEKKEKDEGRRRTLEVKQWLHSEENTVEYENACKARENSDGDSKWILENFKVRKWMGEDSDSKPVLWLNGIPGAGKSVLASVIIEECKERIAFSTSYFYCVQNHDQKNTWISIVRGLLSHLVTENDDLVAYCHERYHSQSSECTLSSAKLTETLLELFCDKLRDLYIIVDGLDECSSVERKQLLALLNRLVDRADEKGLGKLRVLIVSQDEGDIRKGLHTAEVLSLSPNDTAPDIARFVNQQMRKTAEKFSLSNEQVDHTINLTCSRAHGMFLFATLVMSNLYDQPTKHDFELEIEQNRFPEELRGAYERILNRIRSRAKMAASLWKRATQILGWMVCAKRPLRWQEIQAAASIDTERQEFRFDEQKFRFDVKELCGSLINIDHGDRLTLVHSTARFYITDIPPKDGGVRPAMIECNLTAMCLQYLTFPCFDKTTSEPQLKDSILAGHLVLQDYAVATWYQHFRALVEAQPPIDLEDADCRIAISELEPAAEEFVEKYETNLHGEDDSVKPGELECEALQELNCYGSLNLIWSHTQRHLRKTIEERNKVSLQDLSEALERNRKLIEELSASKDTAQNVKHQLSEYYGSHPYKCSKVTCFWFHEGYKEKRARNNHVAKHDRPHRCPIQACTAADIGFTNPKQLEKHMRQFHPDPKEEAETFTPAKAPPQRTPFPCELCEKRFTRRFHLRSHMLNHTQEKPFACSECGRAFTRANDCRRHERTIHSRNR